MEHHSCVFGELNGHFTALHQTSSSSFKLRAVRPLKRVWASHTGKEGRGKDAEARGRKASGKYVLPIQTLFDEAPRIRVRNLSDRQMEQLGELVVANERLAGRPVPKARQRVEFLKRRREVWEQIYNYVTKQDAAATLAALEEAHKQVAAAVSDHSRDRQSVTALKRQLLELQAQVAAAHDQLHHTQDLVQLNRERIQQLTTEATAMQEGVQATRFSQHALAKHPSQQQHKPISHVMPLEQSAAQSSWVPVALSAIVKDGMVTFRHAGHPWVLFRQANGAPAAIEDCCAHRACPLSLGKVVHGQVMCAYHGWKYDARGNCTEMPSTMMCPGIGVNSLACRESEGMVWVADPKAAAQEAPPSSPVRLPDNFTCVGRAQMDVAVDCSSLVEHVLQSGPVIASASSQPDWVATAMSALHGGLGRTAVDAECPGWIVCSTGSNMVEIHTLSASGQGHSRWLYQLAMRKSHWGTFAVPKRVWQKLTEQAVAKHSERLEQPKWPSAGVASV